MDGDPDGAQGNRNLVPNGVGDMHRAMRFTGQVDHAHGERVDAVMDGYEQSDEGEDRHQEMVEMEGMEGDVVVADEGPLGMMVAPGLGNQLTLSFQGEVYVFDSVTPQKVQAVLLLLGGRELTSGMGSSPPTLCQNGKRSNIPQRIASLMRFREKRKERNFSKKIRYDVRKEVAQRMHRHRGQFAPSNPKGEAAINGVTNWNGTENQVSGEASTLVQAASECQHCRVSAESTPMMRRGPDGPRTLCNACGLMWATKGTLRDLSRSSTVTASTEKGLTSDEAIALEKGGEAAAAQQPSRNLDASGHCPPL